MDFLTPKDQVPSDILSNYCTFWDKMGYTFNW